MLAWPGALPCLIGVAALGGLARLLAPHRTSLMFSPAAWGYFLPELTVSYFDNGFTRRALIGTITNLLGIEPSVFAVKAVYALGVILAAAALFVWAWRATRELAARERLLLFVLLALSPATLVHWIEDPGRPDALVEAFAIAAAFACMRGRHMLALAPALAAGLIHEAYFLLFGPLFLALLYERWRAAGMNADEIKRAAILLGGLGLAFLYFLLFGHADYASLERSAARIDVPLNASGANPYYSYLDLKSDPMGWTMCFFREEPAFLINTALAFAFLFVQSWALIGWAGRARVAISLLPALGVAALGLIALDTGRYAAMAAIAIWLYSFQLLRIEKPASIFRLAPFAALLAFTALGPLAISHGFTSVRVISEALGAKPFAPIAMLCDGLP